MVPQEQVSAPFANQNTADFIGKTLLARALAASCSTGNTKIGTLRLFQSVASLTT